MGLLVTRDYVLWCCQDTANRVAHKDISISRFPGDGVTDCTLMKARNELIRVHARGKVSAGGHEHARAQFARGIL